MLKLGPEAPTDSCSPPHGRSVDKCHRRGFEASTDAGLVGGFNPSEKYESQLGLLFPIYGKIKNVPNLQPEGNRSPRPSDLDDFFRHLSTEFKECFWSFWTTFLGLDGFFNGYTYFFTWICHIRSKNI
jgi:hypothetical protein